MNGRGALLISLLVGSAVGCVGPTIKTVPYTPQPDRIQNAPATLRSLILANTNQGCVASPSYNRAMLIVNYACNDGGGGNTVLRFDRVLAIEISQFGEWYGVHVQHRDGAEDFNWESRSLDDIQRMADSIRAIVLQGQEPPEPKAPASTQI